MIHFQQGVPKSRLTYLVQVANVAKLFEHLVYILRYDEWCEQRKIEKEAALMKKNPDEYREK